MSLSDQEIIKKVLWLADIEEIKQLKARYAAACDDHYNTQALGQLFTEDAVWDGGMMGFAETRQGIVEFFDNASNIVGFAVHGISNPIIEIEGDTATGHWYLDQPMAMKNTTECFWYCAQYRDQYQRTEDGWKFSRVKLIARAFTPYEAGFGKQLLADLPT